MHVAAVLGVQRRRPDPLTLKIHVVVYWLRRGLRLNLGSLQKHTCSLGLKHLTRIRMGVREMGRIISMPHTNKPKSNKEKATFITIKV